MRTSFRRYLGFILVGVCGCLQPTSKPDARSFATRIDEITFTNRNYPGIMFGGWGPHLRGVMRAADGHLWFTSDQGLDVQHNEQIIYHCFDGRKWREAARQNHIPGIQQNVASVMADDRIFSYGISIREPRYLEECSLNTRAVADRTCRPIQVGGKPLRLPAGCNYVGAALSPSGRKLVWWTTVGANGAEGQWSYVYEWHSAWIGPVVSALNGYNDFGYVYAAFSNETNVSLAGQLYAGAYPHGRFALGCAEFSLGETIHCTAFTKDVPIGGKAASDIWLYKGGTHVIAETHKGSIAYYYKPPRQSWADCQVPFCILPNVQRARFLDSGKHVYLIIGGANNEGIRIRRMEKRKISGPIEWAAIPDFRIRTTEPGLAAPSAIYVESRCYQTADVKSVNFAAAGHYPNCDNQIWDIELKVR